MLALTEIQSKILATPPSVRDSSGKLAFARQRLWRRTSFRQAPEAASRRQARTLTSRGRPEAGYSGTEAMVQASKIAESGLTYANLCTTS